MWSDYAHRYSTVEQLTKKLNRSEKWVRSQLDNHQVKPRVILPRPIVVVADAMYFGKVWGMLVMRDPHGRENLYWQEIISESPSTYQQGIWKLQQQGFTVRALVIDGRRGVKEGFPGLPIQMCQFHQLQIVNRRLTRKPKLQAGQELRAVALALSKSAEQEFIWLLQGWFNRWANFLKEKTINPETRYWTYTHRRIRSAYFSLRRNLPNLFTFERFPDFNIPKTTNCLEGVFSHVKTAARIHRGLTRQRKRKLIEYLLGQQK